MPDTTLRPLGLRALLTHWRYAAAVVGLGLLVVALPDDAASRWAFVVGAVILYPVLGSVVMARSAGMSGSTPVADPEPASPFEAEPDEVAEAAPVVSPSHPAAAAAEAAARATYLLGMAVPSQRGPLTPNRVPAGVPDRVAAAGPTGALPSDRSFADRSVR